jgi:hypothetical protein
MYSRTNCSSGVGSPELYRMRALAFGAAAASERMEADSMRMTKHTEVVDLLTGMLPASTPWKRTKLAKPKPGFDEVE